MGISTLRDSKIGLPLSRVSSSASSSIFCSTRSASRQISRPRSLADILRQAPLSIFNARRAASTAWSTSAADASAICASTSPVAGFMVLNVFEPSTHWPLISSRPGLIFALLSLHRHSQHPQH